MFFFFLSLILKQNTFITFANQNLKENHNIYKIHNIWLQHQNRKLLSLNKKCKPTS